MPKQIKAKVTVEDSDDGEIHIIFIPDQTQTLIKGISYEFVLEIENEEKEC